MSDLCCGMAMVAAVVVAAFLLFLLILRAYLRNTNRCPAFDTLEKKTVILTGGTSGIGLETCAELVKRGARVVVGVRDPSEEPHAVLKPLLDKKQVRFMSLDLTTLDSVVAFVKEFCSSEERLDVIMHNAGVMCPKEWSVDGLDQSMSVHCYGPVLLTLLLMDKLRGNPTVTRVVFTSIKPTPEKLDINDLDGRRFKSKNILKWYGISKTVQFLLARDMSRRYRRDGVTVYNAYPGLVNTGLFRQLPGFMGSLIHTLGPFILRSPEQGAQTLLYCCAAPGIEPRSGACFTNCELMSQQGIPGYDDEFEEKLWEKTVRTLISKGFRSSLNDYKD